MEIHGNDFGIKCRDGTTPDDIVEVVKQFWPDAVLELDESGEFFLYPNENAKTKWDNEGWSEENDITMILVIPDNDDGKIWFTIDDNSVNMPIIDAIEKELK